jgi:phage gp46-like protein
MLKKPIHDFKIERNNGIYDFAIDNITNTYIEEETGETPILISLLETQRIGLENSFPIIKRGGSYFLDISRGSLIWIKDKATTNDIQLIKSFTLNSLKWLINENYVENIEIEHKLIQKTLTLLITLFINNTKNTLEVIVV